MFAEHVLLPLPLPRLSPLSLTNRRPPGLLKETADSSHRGDKTSSTPAFLLPLHFPGSLSTVYFYFWARRRTGDNWHVKSLGRTLAWLYPNTTAYLLQGQYKPCQISNLSLPSNKHFFCYNCSHLTTAMQTGKQSSQERASTSDFHKW